MRIYVYISCRVESEVVAPNKNGENDFNWLQAKGFVEIVDIALCQVKGHLLDTHVTQELFCNVYQRHFGSRHPIFQLMTPHCEGTTPVGALGVTALTNEGRYMHRLFNMGHIGTRELINEFYKLQDYSDSDFEALLQVNSTRIELY